MAAACLLQNNERLFIIGRTLVLLKVGEHALGLAYRYRPRYVTLRQQSCPRTTVTPEALHELQRTHDRYHHASRRIDTLQSH
jgi:hypothetical protein